MSEIDKRVVQFEFDNRNFEKNAKESINTIDKLKKSLDFEAIGKNLDKVAVKISAFEASTIAAISNITNRLVDAAISFSKSLTIDNAMKGWLNYADKTVSVATMASQTLKVAGKTITDYSQQLEIVNEQLSKLNWFTDQTSYSFTDMVDNIGKFTAAGVDLDVAVNAMMGIANWAALSGQNASTASRAMYQLSQALGKGYVQLIDWKSIQNANMDTQEFRQTVLDTAVAVGKLTKEGENYISKTGGGKFNINQFTEQLSSKWFTSDVLTKSLEKYSSAVEKIYEISNDTGLTAAQVISRYGSELDEFGIKAFKAAQEARTFQQAIDAIKDATTTQWLNTAEKIFGTYEEAKVLWTDLADSLYDMFATSGDMRNEILSVWNTLAGRDDLFTKSDDDGAQGAFWNLFDALQSVIDTVKTSFNYIFPISAFEDTSEKAADLGRQLKYITEAIKNISVNIKKFLTDNQMLANIFNGLFYVLRSCVEAVFSLTYGLLPLINMAKTLSSIVLDFISDISVGLLQTGRVTETIYNMSKYINKIIANVLYGHDIPGTLRVILSMVKTLATTIYGLFDGISKGFWDVFDNNDITLISIINQGLRQTTDIVLTLASLVDKYVAPFITDTLNKFGQIIGRLAGESFNVINIFGKVLGYILNFLNGSTDLNTTLNNIGNTFGELGQKIKDFFNFIKGLFGVENKEEGVGTLLSEKIGSYFGSITTLVKNFSLDKQLFIQLKPILEALIRLGDAILALLSRFGDIIAFIIDVNTEIIKMVAAYDYSKFITWLEENREKIMEIAPKILAITAGLILVIVACKGIYDLLWQIQSVFAPINQLISAISDRIYASAETKRLYTIMAIIESVSKLIASIAIAMIVFTTVPEDRLNDAISSLAAIITILGIFLVAMSKITPLVERSNDYLIGIGGENLREKTNEKYSNSALYVSGIITAMSGLILAMAAVLAIASVSDADKITATFNGLVLSIMAVMVSIKVLVDSIDVNEDIKQQKNFEKALKHYISFIVTIFSAYALLIRSSAKTDAHKITAVSTELVMVIAATIMSIKSLAKLDVSDNLSTLLPAIALLILTFGTVMSAFAFLSMEQLGKAFIGMTMIGMFIAEIVGLFMVVMKSIKFETYDYALSFKTFINSMSVLLLSLAPVIASLSLLAHAGIGQLILSVTLIGALIAEMVGLFMIVQKSNVAKKGFKANILSFAGSISIMVTSIAGALTTLAIIDENKLTTAFGVLSGSMAIMSSILAALSALTMKIPPQYILMVAGALAILSPSILVFAMAIKMISDLDLVDIALQLTLLAASMLALSVSAALIGPAAPILLTVATALDMASLSVYIFVGALDYLADVLPKLSKVMADEEIGTSIDKLIGIVNKSIVPILKLSGAVAVLAIALALLTITAPSIIPTAIGLTVIGGAALIVAEAINIVVKAFDSLVTAVEKMLNIWKNFKDEIKSIFKYIFSRVEYYLDLTIKVLGKIVGKISDILDIIVPFIFKYLANLVNTILDTFNVIAPHLIALIGTILDAIANELNKHVDNYALAVANLINAILKEVDNNIENWMEKLWSIAVKVKKFLFDKGPVLANFIVELVQNVLESVISPLSYVWNNMIAKFWNNSVKPTAESIGNYIRKVWEQIKTGNWASDLESGIWNFMNDIFTIIGNSFNKFFSALLSDIGKVIQYMWEGLKKGLEENLKKYISGPITNFVNTTVYNIKNMLGIHSPSKVFEEIGGYVMQGFGKGITENEVSTENEITNTMSRIIAAVSNSLDEDVDESLIITPILDLSNVRSGANDISSMMSSMNGSTISMSSNIASKASRAVNSRNNSENQNGVINNTTNNSDNYSVVFNVTTNDPEELARETDNILQKRRIRNNMAKGGL